MMTSTIASLVTSFRFMTRDTGKKKFFTFDFYYLYLYFYFAGNQRNSVFRGQKITNFGSKIDKFYK